MPLFLTGLGEWVGQSPKTVQHVQGEPWRRNPISAFYQSMSCVSFSKNSCISYCSLIIMCNLKVRKHFMPQKIAQPPPSKNWLTNKQTKRKQRLVSKMGRLLSYQYTEIILKLCMVFSNTIHKNSFSTKSTRYLFFCIDWTDKNWINCFCIINHICRCTCTCCIVRQVNKQGNKLN